MGCAGHRMLAREVELILKGPVRILPGESKDAGEGVIPDRGTGTYRSTEAASLLAWRWRVCLPEQVQRNRSVPGLGRFHMLQLLRPAQQSRRL